MSRLPLLRCIAALGSLAALTISAQPAPPAAAAAPFAAASQPQATGYRSTFETYQPFTDEKILPWKLANDTAATIGGWRAYARQAQDAAPAGEAPRRDPAGPAGGHGHH